MQSRNAFGLSLAALLLLDAMTSAAMALLLITLAGPLSVLLGLPALLLRGAGLALVPFAAMLALIVRSGARSRTAIVAVVLCNVLWVAGSVLLLLGGVVQPTAPGTAFVLLQAGAVAGFAAAQAASIPRPVGAPTAAR